MRGLLFVVLVIATASGAEPLQVALRGQVEFAGRRVLLSDIAVITGEAAQIAALADVVVLELSGSAPHTLDVALIRPLIGKRLPNEPVTITGTCALTRARRKIEEAELVQAATAAVGADAEVSLLRCSGAVTVPNEGAEPALVVEPLDSAVAGDLPLRVRVVGVETELARALVVVRVVRFATVAVAANAIARDATITAADLRVERVKLSGTPYFTDVSAPVGQVARVAIAAGAPVPRSGITIVPEVKSQRQVTLVYRHAGFEVQATGTALADGRTGETIAVRRVDGRSVKALVIGPGQAQVNPD